MFLTSWAIGVTSESYLVSPSATASAGLRGSGSDLGKPVETLPQVMVPPWSQRLSPISATRPKLVAGTTGLEPATSAVTGQRSNQLNYVPRVTVRVAEWWAVTDLNRGPSRCKRDALTAELTALDRTHPNRSCA